MSHALTDLLANRFDPEPPEIATIKQYIQDNFGQTVAVAVRDRQIIINTKSSAVAGALRPHLYKLKTLCKTDKQLLVRIGH